VPEKTSELNLYDTLLGNIELYWDPHIERGRAFRLKVALFGLQYRRNSAIYGQNSVSLDKTVNRDQTRDPQGCVARLQTPRYCYDRRLLLVLETRLAISTSVLFSLDLSFLGSTRLCSLL